MILFQCLHSLRIVLNSIRTCRRCRNLAAFATPESLECRQVLTASMIGAVSGDGEWAFDTNGTPDTEINRSFGLHQDQFTVGNWTGHGDQPGVARVRPDGFLQWYLNTDAAVSPTHEVDFLFGLAGDTAVAGDWDGNGTTNVGVVRDNSAGGLDWYLDLNTDPNAERVQSFGLHGDIPVVGDWDNNGTANVGVVRRTQSGFLEWHMDVTGDAWPEVSRIFGLAGDSPVVGDWDGNGLIDIGVTRAQATGGQMQWLLDTNGDPLPDLPAITFGNAGSKPVVGRWSFAEVQVSLVSTSQVTAIADGSALPFGTWVQGDDVVRTLRITNTGNARLELSHLSLPSRFVLVNPFPGNVEPGGQKDFQIRLETTHAGSFSGQFSFVTNDGNESSFNFSLSGVVETPAPRLNLTGNGNFGEIVQGSTGTLIRRNFIVENRGNSPLTYSAAVSTSYRILSGQHGTIAKNSSTTLVVQMNSRTLGSKPGTLTITSNSVQNPVFQQPLSTTVVPQVRTLDINGSGAFGDIGIGTTTPARERTFTIRNSGNSPLTFSASVNNSHFAIISGRSATVAPNGGIATIVVRVQNSTTGTKSGTLAISSNASTTPVVSVGLSARVIARSARMEVIGSGNFGQISLNATNGSSEREFLIRNNGNALLTYNVTLSNTNFLIVSGGQGSVNPNSTIKLIVRMKSSTTGSKNASLTIRSNDSTNPTSTVGLTGSVVAVSSNARPEVAVLIGTKTLAPGEAGQLYYGASAVAVRTKAFLIKNTGSGVLRVTSPSIVGEFVHNMPAVFQLQPGASRWVKVTMRPNSEGTKLGRLTFTTNDGDEGQIHINLLGRQFAPITSTPGNAASPAKGIYTIYHGGNEPIFMDPSFGGTPANGRFVVSIGDSKVHLSGIVTRIVIVSNTRPVVQNWTGVTLIWQSPTGNVTLPRVQNDLDLFQER